jgi:poly-gamma-glutamate synthesis protein (capsule biosynthesis protein)
VFSAIQPVLSKADLRIGNLESPITSAQMQKESYDLRAPAESVAALTSAHFDDLCFNNNHTMDAGKPGIEDTVKSVRSGNINLLAPDTPTELIKIKGISIEIVCLNDLDNAGTLDAYTQLASSFKETSDFKIVYIHWGAEYQSEPSDHERRLARDLANAGADVIIGSHPHILQPVEKLQVKDRTVWVAYSLGNAVFDQNFMKSTRQSAVLLLTLQKNRSQEIEFFPFMIDPSQGGIVLPSTEEKQSILDLLHYPLPEYTDSPKP